MLSQENEGLCYETQHKQFNEEQETVRSYVLKKSLQRPKTNFFSIFSILLFYCLFCGILSFLFLRYFPASFRLRVLFALLIWVIVFCVIARRFLIKIVECYQHYAKESTRRKCLCMPTCSEYAIEVLKKDFLLVALFKIRKRLFVTCKNGLYKIDPP